MDPSEFSDDAFESRLRLKLREAFDREALGHAQWLRAALTRLEELERRPPGAGAESALALLDEMFRVAHSLKGAARAVQDAAIEARSLALEQVLVDRLDAVALPQASAAVHQACAGLLPLLPRPAVPAEASRHGPTRDANV